MPLAEAATGAGTARPARRDVSSAAVVDDRSDEEREQPERDEEEFLSLRPVLADDDVEWLDEALALVAPEHPWRDALRRER